MQSRTEGKTVTGNHKGVNRPKASRNGSKTDIDDEGPASHMQGQQWQMPLRFVNFNHPSQTNARQYRKAIRSHVTSLQHKRSKKHASNKGKRSDRPARQQLLDEDPTLAYPTPTDTQSPAWSTAQDENATERTPNLNQQVAMSRVDPFRTRDAAADWSIEIPLLIDHYLDTASAYMSSNGLVEESRALHSRLVQPRLYLDGFLFNALITLTTTRVAVVSDQRRCEPLVAWLRSNFLMTIQAAIRSGFDDPKALAVGIALLIGWELDVGDPSTCPVHLKALPSVINSQDSSGPTANFEYRSEYSAAVFRSGPWIPPGFEFFASQNLLPPSLMFHIGSLAYFDASAPGSSLWMRELWSSIGACAPMQETASKAISERTLSSRISQLVRQAGIMIGSFMRLSAGEQPVAQPLRTGIQALWHATLSTELESMIGTVYDGILLWCLCVFCTTSGYRDKYHLEAISKLLVKLDVRSLRGLIALLQTFLCPNCLYGPLAELWRRRGERKMEVTMV